MICVMLSLSATSASAASRVSSEELVACKTLTDQVTALIRGGQTVITTRLQLRRCARIQRAEQRRAAREAVGEAKSDPAPKLP
jgi:hypothetical protein